MKKLLGILAIATLLSCSKDDEEQPAKEDCNCDRVVSVTPPFTLPGGYKFGNYYTINDCTKLQSMKKYEGTGPKIGECK